MYRLNEIQPRSRSTELLVLEYTDALDALEIFSQGDARVLSWSGWTISDSGVLSIVQRYSDVVVPDQVTRKAAVELARLGIMQASTEWTSTSTGIESELLFSFSVAG